MNLKRVSPRHSPRTSHAHGSATTSASVTTIGNGCPRRCRWLTSQHSAASFGRWSNTFVTQPNHCCAHNLRVSPHQIVQLARAMFRPTAATPNRNEHLRKYKNCVIMTAHDASKAVRASVTTVPSFLKQNGLMYGVIRRQDIDKRGLTIGCKTAMVSNLTAITLQCVSGQASAEPDRPTEAHFAASS